MTTAAKLRAASGARGFRPSDVAGLAVWYKADGLGLADNAAVASWTDETANARHATQAVAGERPTYKVAIRAGRPVVRFDGGDSLDTATFTLNQPNTIIVVCAHVVDFAGDKIMVDGNGATNRNIVCIQGGNWRIYAGAFVGATAADAAWHVHTGLFNGVSSLHRLDGTQTATGNAGAAAIGGLRLGGWSDGATGRMSGDIAEICVYNAALSLGNQQAVERHFGAKYGIAVA